MSPVNGWNKKHSSKKAVPRIYTLEKRVFAVGTFKGLRMVFFFLDKVKKGVVYFGLFEPSLHF